MTTEQSRQRILIVDDMPEDIKFLGEALRADYDIIIAVSAKKAMEIIASNPPDLILLDIMMPEMNGYEICGRLKEDERTKNIPVIFNTGKGEVEDEMRGLELGAVDYITKPFSIPIVKARVKTHLQLRASGIQLERQNQTLRELNNMKNEFIGMAAHDLRNPLGSVCGLAQLLNEGESALSAQERSDYLKAIESTGLRMLGIVDNLLDISVIESGNLKLEVGKWPLDELCRERIQIFGIQARKKKISLHTSFNKMDDFPFDKNQISQALDNLLSNAIKFSPLGSNVYISTEKDGDRAKVSVRDEGPGISEKDKARLFGSFQKLSAKPTGGEKSTGLGLAITKKIIEAHGGTIGVETRLGAGTTFSFSIPTGIGIL